eukprot:Sspe_Gene.71247::Locus_42200_Transcript_1_1_Confidence_1.000_Length_881::g.71247::m.71247
MGDVDDLYSFAPCSSSYSQEYSTRVPPPPRPSSQDVSPKAGRRAPGAEVIDSMANENDKLMQEARMKARLAEKREKRAGDSLEADRFRQEAFRNNKLAEKRASRSMAKASPRGSDVPSPSADKTKGWSFTDGARKGNIHEPNSETASYLATYERVLQEALLEQKIAEKRAKSVGATGVAVPPPPGQLKPNNDIYARPVSPGFERDANSSHPTSSYDFGGPPGDSLDDLRARIDLAEARGASPEPARHHYPGLTRAPY